ncbi:MAG: SpoIID/LytB domain-containing protein, partial [Oscillospiraceae bacterium]|nr:SpoIID/LytB domain-containing protein [Oscillospiraceae bacterium]
QAVAARTYALYCTATGKHPDADVCTDFHCCQAWKSEAELRETWGVDFDRFQQAVHEAVASTAGTYLSYEGRPVFAAYHAASAGATEDSGQLWSPQPYLLSVPSPEGADTVPNYVTTLDCSPLDFRDTLLSAWPQADFTGEADTWLGPIARDESGRVQTVILGGVEIPGTELRRLFALRSAAFTLDYREGRFRFTVTGSGHGVGMSQYGARVLAEEGMDCVAILAHYYPGTSLVTGG